MIKKKTIAEQTNTIVQLCLDTKITPGGQGLIHIWATRSCDALNEMVLEQQVIEIFFFDLEYYL